VSLFPAIIVLAALALALYLPLLKRTLVLEFCRVSTDLLKPEVIDCDHVIVNGPNGLTTL
jgi:hypothetical protein